MAHDFVEAFVWKFRHPFYRQTLAPLYFGVPQRSAGSMAEKLVQPASLVSG